MEECCISSGIFCQHFHCCGGEWQETYADDVIAREVTKRKSDGVIRGEFVIAISRDEDCARAVNPPSNEPQEIQGCFIGPMQILQHDQTHSFGLRELFEDN